MTQSSKAVACSVVNTWVPSSSDFTYWPFSAGVSLSHGLSFLLEEPAANIPIQDFVLAWVLEDLRSSSQLGIWVEFA